MVCSSVVAQDGANHLPDEEYHAWQPSTNLSIDESPPLSSLVHSLDESSCDMLQSLMMSTEDVDCSPRTNSCKHDQDQDHDAADENDTAVAGGAEEILQRLPLHDTGRRQRRQLDALYSPATPISSPTTRKSNYSFNYLQDDSSSISLSSLNTNPTKSSTGESSFCSLSSSLSKGEEHISSRLKRYGIVRRKKSVPASRVRTAPLHVQMAVEEVHRWLFVEGGHFEDVQSLMTEYSNYIREEFGIPLDRLYYGGVGLHPKLTAYLWRWEPTEFEHREMPQEIFERRNELFSPDEPFCVLEQGRAEFVRIRDSDTYIPPDTEKWFRAGGYKDYFALPDIHRGVSKGGLAWSTKNPDGFSEDDIQFFQLTHSALTTIMRLHTNDLVLKTLTDRMEKEIDDRTNELASANRKLELANAEISKQSAKQLEHFASMSHEIRTPLNCIVGLSSLLLDSDDMSDANMDSIKMIHSSADLLAGVVNDVLDYAKLESGHFEVDIRSIDLQSTVDAVVLSISNKVMEKNVKVRTNYCGMLPRMINTDSRRLQQILYNLLGNAGKFSRDGTFIDFSIRLVTDTSSGQNKIRFAVKDYGKGIDKSDFESIFRPFSQASKETQTIYGGTGLGLSITSKLINKLGGTISVDSELGKYAEFVVELPYDGDIIDPSVYKQKLRNTTIVILDQNEKFTSTYSMEDEFMPLCPTLVKVAGLSVIRSSKWLELKEKLGLDVGGKHYVFLVNQDLEEMNAIEHMKTRLGEGNSSWFTFGSKPTGNIRHFKSLTGIFPSILLDTISEAVAFDYAKRDRDANKSKKLSSLRSSNIAVEGIADKPLMKLGTQKGSCDAAITSSTLKPVSSESTPLPEKKSPVKCPPKSTKVLYAEDNLVNQKVLERVLKRLGVSDITIVDNGLKAVQLCETNKYDCIFMDMQMPVMDGLEACERIMARDPKEKVVFVTAHALSDFKERADAAGAFDFVSKPFNIQKIDSLLKSLETELE